MTNYEFDLLLNSIEGEVSDLSIDTGEENQKAKKESKMKYNDVLNKTYRDEGYLKDLSMLNLYSSNSFQILALLLHLPHILITFVK